jgi:hypothetical protein
VAVLSVRPVDLRFAVPTFTKGVKVGQPAEAQVSVRITGVTSLNIQGSGANLAPRARKSCDRQPRPPHLYKKRKGWASPELETHTGLIVQAGTDLFEFSHKSLQEYLTAVFIVGLPAIPTNMIELQVMPNELAIATALSSRPSEYFYALVARHFSQIKLSFHFVRTFINRLLIERPDFEMSHEVGLAILLLYSQYLRASIEEASQRQLFISDPLSGEFEHLNVLIKERIEIADLMGVYGKESLAYGLDGEEIWRLESKATKGEGRFRLYTRGNILPSVLWVRKSLVG